MSKHQPVSPEELRDILEELGLTQAELAAEIDVSTRAVEFWLSGQRVCRGPAAILLRMMSQARSAIAKDVKQCLRAKLEAME